MDFESCELDVEAGLVGLELDGVAKSFGGGCGFAIVFEDRAQESPGVAIQRGEGGCELELSGSLGRVTLLHVNDTQGVGRVGELGVKLGGALELGNGGGQVVLQLIGEAGVVVKVGAGGIKGETRAKLYEGVIKVLLLEVGSAVVFAESGGVGAESEGLGVERKGPGGVASLNLRESIVDKDGAGGDVRRGCEFGEDRERVCWVTAGLEGEGQKIQRVSWSRGCAKGEGAFELRESSWVVVRGRERASVLELGVKGFGKRSGSGFERGEGLVGLIQCKQSHAEMVLGKRKRGIEGGSTLKVGDGAVELAGLCDESAECVFERGIVGICGQGGVDNCLRGGEVVRGREGGGVANGLLR